MMISFFQKILGHTDGLWFGLMSSTRIYVNYIALWEEGIA